MNFWGTLFNAIFSTIRDVMPIVAIIAFFQLAVLRRPLANLPRLSTGFVFVVLGLSLFLMGLQLALFPLGEEMAAQLVADQVAAPVEAPLLQEEDAAPVSGPPWYHYYWTYLFAFCIGMSTTIAEPSLMAVAMKAQQVSGGTIQAWGLRLAVALGVGIGVTLGTFRIITGIPLPYFIIVAYFVVIVQTYFAPRQIIPLAYDSGGVTSSTVTVPLVTALGLGLADRVPGRDPLTDGFGLIAFAVLFPIMSVMGYAQLAAWWSNRQQRKLESSQLEEPQREATSLQSIQES